MAASTRTSWGRTGTRYARTSRTRGSPSRRGPDGTALAPLADRARHGLGAPHALRAARHAQETAPGVVRREAEAQMRWQKGQGHWRTIEELERAIEATLKP